MSKLVESRKFVLIAFSALIIGVGYAFSIFDDPRLSGGGLEFGEANFVEIIVIMLAPISAAIMWLSVLIHSFGNGKKLWGVMTLFVWPIAFLYALYINFICSPHNHARSR